MGRLLIFLAFSVAGCFGEKPNSLRAEGRGGTNGGLVISGIIEDEFTGRIQEVSGGANTGAHARFSATAPNGVRQTFMIEPFFGGLPVCSPGQCALRVEKIQYPDGAELRLTVDRKGETIFLATTGSRLRRLPGGVALRPGAPINTGASGSRQSVQVRVGAQTAEPGKSISIAGSGAVPAEKRSCEFHLFNATVSGPARPGIAEESPSFTADWIFVCNQ
jgi:hypothetical protein